MLKITKYTLIATITMVLALAFWHGVMPSEYHWLIGADLKRFGGFALMWVTLGGLALLSTIFAEAEVKDLDGTLRDMRRREAEMLEALRASRQKPQPKPQSVNVVQFPNKE